MSDWRFTDIGHMLYIPESISFHHTERHIFGNVSIGVEAEEAVTFEYSRGYVAGFIDSLFVEEEADYDIDHIVHLIADAYTIGEDVEWALASLNLMNFVTEFDIVNTLDAATFRFHTSSHEYNVAESVFVQNGSGYNQSIHWAVGTTEFTSLGQTVEYDHIRLNNCVYDIKHDAWTKFADYKIKDAHPIIKGSADENVVLCVHVGGDSKEKVMRYPGSGESDYSSVRTKDYFIEHGVFQAYNLNYDEGLQANGSTTTITKNADVGYEKRADRSVTEISPHKWEGFEPGAGYGFVGSIVMKKLYKVKDLILKYKLRLEE